MSEPAKRLHLVPAEKMKLGDSIGQIAPDKWFTRKQTSLLVGKSVSTLKRWQRKGIFVASGTMQAGAIEVRMYSLKDIEKLKSISSQIKPGRKPPKPK